MRSRERATLAACLLPFLLSACATKLAEVPEREEIVKEALPETTTIAAE